MGDKVYVAVCVEESDDYYASETILCVSKNEKKCIEALEKRYEKTILADYEAACFEGVSYSITDYKSGFYEHGQVYEIEMEE